MCLKTAYVKHNVLYPVLDKQYASNRHEVTEVWEKLGNKNPITYKIIIVAAGRWLRRSLESNLSYPFPLEVLNNWTTEEGREYKFDQR